MKTKEQSVFLDSNRRVQNLVLDAILAALGVVLMLMLRVPLVPAAPWMLYEMGDIPAMIGGLLLGPGHGLLILAVICIVQMVTPNSSGFYGLLMHFLASGILVVLPALFWKRRQTSPSLISGLVLAALLMTALMIPLNLLITPLFLGVPVEAVTGMILPILLPFNMIKGLLNGLGTFLVFHGIRRIARKYNQR